MGNLTVALDVDGVLSPITPVGFGEPKNAFEGWEYRILSERNFGAAVGEPVVKTLRDLVENGVTIKWHTTWGTMADSLSEELDLPQFEQFSQRTADAGWWKLTAIEKWVVATEGTDERLLWLDDDIQDAVITAGVSRDVLHNPRVSILSPNVYWGLSPRDLEKIEGVAYRGERVALANDPQAPRPLPTNPGSVISWAEPADDEADEKWTATAILMSDPDGTSFWSDSYVDQNEPSKELFSPEHLDTVEWIELVATVPAVDATFDVREAFEAGDGIVGAVFEAELDGVDDVFTTAPGGYYNGEFFDVVDVDAYGNLSHEEDDRRILFLPVQGSAQ